MNKPLISILIPYYNHNHYIKETLDSIIADTYPNKEIILINDGSTEESDESIINWIKEHEKEINITYIKQKNLGITKTANKLIHLAKGKYIAFTASDDFYINNTFQDRVNTMQNNPNKLMLVSDAIIVDGDSKKLYNSAMCDFKKVNINNYFNDSGLKYEIIKNWSIVGSTPFMDKNLFNEVGYYNENIIVEDWDFFLRVVAKDLLLYHDKQVVAYRVHDTNASKNPEVRLQQIRDLYLTAKNNLHLFRFPSKIYLWKRYRRIYKGYRKKENNKKKLTLIFSIKQFFKDLKLLFQ